MTGHTHRLFAADCGASGGKLAAASYDGERLVVDEYLSFPNHPVQLLDATYIDYFAIYRHVLDGLKRMTRRYGAPATVGFDAHGAAYALLDRFGRMVHPMFHSRDMTTAPGLDGLYERCSGEEVFRLTGCRCGIGYTLLQLYSRVMAADPCLEYAERLLMLPDLLSYSFCGEMIAERTIAGTSGLANYTQNGWSGELLERLGIPERLFLPLSDPGAVLGDLTGPLEEETGAAGARVVSVAGHDSAAAVASIPRFGTGSLYICAGTSTNMGVESGSPDISEEAFRCGFKNAAMGEPGRFLIYHDFPAFILVNAVKAEWERQGVSYSYDEVQDMLDSSGPAESYVNLESPGLTNVHEGILGRLTAHLEETGQRVPRTHVGWLRCLFESVAMQAAHYARLMQEELHNPIREVFVVNGGSWYPMLCQTISNATGLPVRAGIPYASLAGNLLWQLRATGELASLDEMREVAARSFTMDIFEPEDRAVWDQAYGLAVERGLFVYGASPEGGGVE